MIRLIVFLSILFAIAFGLSVLVDWPGQVVIATGGAEYSLELGTAALAVLVLCALLVVLWRLVLSVLRLPSFLSLSHRIRRQNKGRHALANGLIALAAGDLRQAQHAAREAGKLLPKDPLTALLAAQTAQLAGDDRGAQTAFSAMIERPETASIGYRGLYIEAQRRGDKPKADAVAEAALQRDPATPWALEAMMQAAARRSEWRKALGLLDQLVSRRLLRREDAQTLRVVLLTAAAQQAGEGPQSLGLALEAVRLKPDFVPAAELAATRLATQGEAKRASRVIETAWKASPHPDLARAFVHIRHGDSALDRLKRAQYLAKTTPDARESRFMLAQAALEAREFEQARRELDALALQTPSIRVCLLMTKLEDAENNPAQSRLWLARAARAPRDPAWVAEGVVSRLWHPVTPSGQIGGFVWQKPPESAMPGLEITLPELEEAIEAHLLEGPANKAPSADALAAPVVLLTDAPSMQISATQANATKEATTGRMPFGDFTLHQPDDPGPRAEKIPKKRWFF